MMSADGLLVWYDGKKYRAFFNGTSKEYPIGGLACEYSRFKPYTLKDVIMECPAFDKSPDTEGVKDEVAKWLFEILFEKYEPVIATMILTELGDYVHDYLWADDETKNGFISELNAGIEGDKVKEFILKDTGLNKFSIDTMGAMLLSAYCTFATSYVVFRHSLDMLANDGGEEGEVGRFMEFYGENIEFQHIEYKLALIEGKFAELFTIKSSLSLILFETAHVLDSQTPILKCKNCGQYFVPTGRSDSIYCSYPSPQDPEKTCKDIGAQVSRSNKEKTDVTTKEYRRVYMRYKMLMRRHPEEESYEEQFNRLTSEVKEWRNKLAHGMATTEEFLAWLMEFSENNPK